MKRECSIVRDLLPLYMEGMVSEETADFVGEHLAACQPCQEEYQQLKQPTDLEQPPQEEHPAVPLRLLKRKLVAKRVQTALLAGVFVAVVLLSAFAILSTPRYFPYTGDLLEVTPQADGSVSITLNERVTNYSVFAVPATQENAGRMEYYIEGWTSVWEQWFSNRGEQTMTLSPPGNAAVAVYYAQNNGQEDVLLYGDQTGGGVVTLPGLVLGYYLFLAMAVFVVLLVVWLVVRKKLQVRQWVERALLLPPSYAVGHIIVLGFTTKSYSTTRDFILIVAIGALLYCLLLLAGSVFRLWREWKSTR